MPLYELRTYTLHVGKMAEATKVYQEFGWPMIAQWPENLVGYFTGDVGALNQLVHLWKFRDDADRRAFWAKFYADPKFPAFAERIRPLIQHQDNRLMHGAPWGPSP